MIGSVCKLMFASSRLATAIVAGAVMASSAQVASALTYTTTPGSQTLYSLGDTIGSSYDQLQILGATGALNSNTDIVLNTLKFTAGVNATVPANYSGLNSSKYTFTETVTINAGPNGPSGSQNLIVPFNLTISSADTLTVLGGTSVSIPVGSSIWNIVVSQLVIGPNSGGTITELLMAHVTDPPGATPLPAALILFGSGLGAIGMLRRLKRTQARAALA